jgi:hypothetical protein
MARRATTDADEKPDASADGKPDASEESGSSCPIGPSRLAPAQQTQIKGPFDERKNLIRALYGQGQALPVGLVYLHIQSTMPPPPLLPYKFMGGRSSQTRASRQDPSRPRLQMEKGLLARRRGLHSFCRNNWVGHRAHRAAAPATTLQAHGWEHK